MTDEQQKATEVSKSDVERLVSGFSEGLRAAQTALINASFAMNRFGDAMWKVAEKEYLKCHKKLPGGTGNPRLFKKRRTLVLKWYLKHIQRH